MFFSVVHIFCKIVIFFKPKFKNLVFNRNYQNFIPAFLKRNSKRTTDVTLNFIRKISYQGIVKFL